MYKEEEVVGKGIGCIATEEISPGCLVLRETPCLFLPPGGEDSSALLQRTVKAFLGMESEEQEKYLQLANMFDRDESEWSDTARKDMENIKSELEAQPLTDLPPSDIIKIWQIKLTNGFHNGVFLKMSRFNHSCHPNAAMVCHFNNAQDVRALRKIKQGEEITICYTGCNESLWSREERRAELKNVYNFDCNCGGCEMAEEQIEQENENIAAFKQEAESQQERAKTFERMTRNQQNEVRFNFIKEEE